MTPAVSWRAATLDPAVRTVLKLVACHRGAGGLPRRRRRRAHPGHERARRRRHERRGAPVPQQPRPALARLRPQRRRCIATLYGEQNRAPVPLGEIPTQVRDAIIVVEDENFYSHDGVNLRATVRALFENVSAGGIEQGGSTITMQVVKNSVLGSRARPSSRKTREAILALRLEEELTKDQILERYLNTAYFGNGAYGVQAAAETYWGVGVGAARLGPGGAARRPDPQPQRLQPDPLPRASPSSGARLALDRLVDTGHITEDEADVYAFQPLPTRGAADHARRPTTTSSRRSSSCSSTIPRFGIGDTLRGALQRRVLRRPAHPHDASTRRMQLLAVRGPRRHPARATTPGSFHVALRRRRRAGHRRRRDDRRRTPARCAPSSAAPASTTTATTSPPRASGASRARRSRSSCWPPRSSPASCPTTRSAARRRAASRTPAATPTRPSIDNFGESRGGGGNITTPDPALVELRLRPARSDRRARRGSSTWPAAWASRTPLDAGARRCRSAPRRCCPSRWRRPTPPSPTTASTTSPYYIDRIEDAEGNVLYQHAAERPPGRHPPDGPAGDRGARGERARRHRHPGPGRRPSRRPARPAPRSEPRRLVRRLHAAVRHGGVDGRAPAARCRCAASAASP